MSQKYFHLPYYPEHGRWVSQKVGWAQTTVQGSSEVKPVTCRCTVLTCSDPLSLPSLYASQEQKSSPQFTARRTTSPSPQAPCSRDEESPPHGFRWTQPSCQTDTSIATLALGAAEIRTRGTERTTKMAVQDSNRSLKYKHHGKD
jgi:hypothetical protein